MTLEERYNAAGNETYVGRVKNLQAADAGAGSGVNFLDGDQRSVWSPGSTAAPDQVQTEFTRNNAGDFRYGGGGKVPGAYTLSRWLNKGIEKGDTYLSNNRFTTVSDPRNASTLLQKYNWLKEDATFAGKLPDLTKGRVNGAASGPSPAGLNG
jgi:hypothetical protein